MKVLHGAKPSWTLQLVCASLQSVHTPQITMQAARPSCIMPTGTPVKRSRASHSEQNNHDMPHLKPDPFESLHASATFDITCQHIVLSREIWCPCLSKQQKSKMNALHHTPVCSPEWGGFALMCWAGVLDAWCAPALQFACTTGQDSMQGKPRKKTLCLPKRQICCRCWRLANSQP